MEDIYQVGEVCRGAVIISVNSFNASAGFVFETNDVAAVVVSLPLPNQGPTPTITEFPAGQIELPMIRNFQTSEVKALPNSPYSLIVGFGFEIPNTDSRSYAFKLRNTRSVQTETYRHCQVLSP